MASYQALSCPITAVGGGVIPMEVKPPGLDILWRRVDRLDTCVTEFYMEYIVCTRAYLSYVRAIVAFRRVSLV
jgi:hypothetical protein